jgi:hypothetical protein
MGSRVNIQMNFFFKFTLRCQQPVKLAPAANLLPVSLTLVEKLATGVVDTSGAS